jgi:hypothetical protein
MISDEEDSGIESEEEMVMDTRPPRPLRSPPPPLPPSQPQPLIHEGIGPGRKRRCSRGEDETAPPSKQVHSCDSVCLYKDMTLEEANAMAEGDYGDDPFRAQCKLPMGLPHQAVNAMSRYMCSEALFQMACILSLSLRSEMAVAIHLRGRFLLTFLQANATPELNRLTVFLRDMDLDSIQALVARIFFETWRANAVRDNTLVDQFIGLFMKSIEKYPEAADDYKMCLFVDPLCQMGLWHYLRRLEKSPAAAAPATVASGSRLLIRLADEYYGARWMPFFNCGPVTEPRIYCVSSQFADPHIYNDTRFVEPLMERNLDDGAPPQDTDYTYSEWLLALLRGLAHATADFRFPEALAMGFCLIFKYIKEKKPYSLFRVDLWGYLAIAVAGMDLHGPDTAFFCIERMRECCQTVSDRCHYLATVVRVRELLHLSTHVAYAEALNEPQLPRLSEQFVEIVFAHVRSLFRRVEDLMLGFVREHVLHHECPNLEACYFRTLKVKIAIAETLGRVHRILNDRHLWTYQHADVAPRVQNYKLVVAMMDAMVANMERKKSFSMSKLIKAAEKLAEASDERVDWPTFHVYAKLALLWFPHDEDFSFQRSLDNLRRKAQSLVGYRYSRTEADMMTSALLLHVFGRSLEKPGHPNCMRVTVDPSLIYELQKVMEKVPASFPGVLDFRSSVICSIKSLVFTTHIRHARTKRKDVFWSKWRLSDLSYVSSMGYKNHYLVDRQKKGLSNVERTAYHDQLGARAELNSRGDNATEVEESEAARDVQLIRIIRTSSSGFLEMARGFGWERLERNRRI